jgi:hypothetical protein
VGPIGWSGDELGEMLQQGRLPADAVLGTQAPVGQLANGSVEPRPGGIHDHTGLPVHQFVTVAR